jgi:predicted anti-sigma-YlaC factor YlaD
MNRDCVQACSWLARWADGELTAPQSGWIEVHWESCPSCRGERDRFQSLDGHLVSFGNEIVPLIEASTARARFLAGTDNPECARENRWALPWTAMLLAAATAPLIWVSPRATRTVGPDDSGFVAVPYVLPLASYERSEVVSMRIPVAHLLAEGYRIAADPSEVVEAEVLLGEDGQVHAVRLAANQILKGTGD